MSPFPTAPTNSPPHTAAKKKWPGPIAGEKDAIAAANAELLAATGSGITTPAQIKGTDDEKTGGRHGKGKKGGR